MDNIFQNMLGMTLTGSILTLLVLAALPITKRLFSPRWHCLLLCAILLFFLLPVGTTTSTLLEGSLNMAPFADDGNLAALWDEIPAPLFEPMINQQTQASTHSVNLFVQACVCG